MSQEESAVLAHPEVAPYATSASASLLLTELSLTVALENRLISPVALDIATRALRADYPDVAVTDAMRVQCDEAYHGVLASEVLEKVQRVSGVPARCREHPFLVHLDRLLLTFAAEDAPLVRFCAAVVSETLITGTLLKERLRAEIDDDVRTFREHHYRDELRHSSFFAQMLQIVWPQWPEALRSALRPTWPGLVDAFLAVDDSLTVAALCDAGIAPGRANAVVAECRQVGAASSRRAASIKVAESALHRAGALGGTRLLQGAAAW